MAIDTTPSTVATNALAAIPFESLIGGPLNACVEAQAMAAQTSWEFIQAVGLNPPDEDGNRSTTQVTFSYQADGQLVNINVPLIAIVPIPFMAVQECNIDFMANISAESSSVATETTAEEIGGEVSGSVKVGWGPFNVETNFAANYSSKKDSTATQESRYSVEYTMNVGVKAGQADMPGGLAAVLNLMNSSLAATPVDGVLEVTPLVTSLDADDLNLTALIAAKATNPDGLDAQDLTVTWTLAEAPNNDIDVTVVNGTQDGDTGWDGTTLAVNTDLTGMAQVMVAITDAEIATTRLTFDVTATFGTVEHATTVVINVFNVATDDNPPLAGQTLQAVRRRRLSSAERLALRAPRIEATSTPAAKSSPAKDRKGSKGPAAKK